jgi:hypothetical protein
MVRSLSGGDISYLDLIPPRWLHLTMQGIGFTDEIGSADLTAVTEAIRNRLREANPPIVTFHEPTIRKEAVYLKAVPKEPVYELRQAVYEAVISVLGSDRLDEAPPDPAKYTPHVSVSYANSDGPAEPIAEALSNIESEPVTTTFNTRLFLSSTVIIGCMSGPKPHRYPLAERDSRINWASAARSGIGSLSMCRGTVEDATYLQ